MIARAKLLARHELAAELQVCTATIDRWCRVGILGVRLARELIGGRIFFRPEDVEAWRKAVAQRRALPLQQYMRDEKMRAMHEEAVRRQRARGINVQ